MDVCGATGNISSSPFIICGTLLFRIQEQVCILTSVFYLNPSSCVVFSLVLKWQMQVFYSHLQAVAVSAPVLLLWVFYLCNIRAFSHTSLKCF